MNDNKGDNNRIQNQCKVSYFSISAGIKGSLCYDCYKNIQDVFNSPSLTNLDEFW